MLVGLLFFSAGLNFTAGVVAVLVGNFGWAAANAVAVCLCLVVGAWIARR